MSQFNRFRRGQSTYNCWNCGKLTRDTGNGEGGNESCAHCFEMFGLENSILDGVYSGEELTKAKQRLEKMQKVVDARKKV